MTGEPDVAHIGFSEPDIGAAELAAVERVLDSGWLTTGSESAALEEELASYLGVGHVVAVSSCTAAIEIAYAALRLPPGARVGVPAWTFVSSALAPAHRGARIVALDVDVDTGNLAPHALQADLDRLDAVVGVHFAGTPMSSEVRKLCHDAAVPLIEDAAHALGASDDRGMVAGQGTAGAAFSFYATKNLTSGEGGAIATDDADLAHLAKVLRLHGLSKDAWARYEPGRETIGYDVLEPGMKANLPDLLAAVARAQLERFPGMQKRRRSLVTRYRANLEQIAGLEVIPAALEVGSADHLMVVLLPESADRRQVRERLTARSIGTSVHFTPLHRFTWFKKSQSERGRTGLGATEALEPRALSLPLHTRLREADVDRVCDELAGALR